jgi:RNA polymerase sigma-70 factor (ECF subfamily)
MAEGFEVGLRRLDALAGDGQLASYPYFHSARADLLRRLGRTEEAIDAYRAAIALTANEVEREFLLGRITQLGGVRPS